VNKAFRTDVNTDSGDVNKDSGDVNISRKEAGRTRIDIDV
jgi:hypothetical protein